MYTVDEVIMDAPVIACFNAGADVERWPDRLPHYRWVRFLDKRGFGTGRVEMAARRSFGPLAYPVWWVSEMRIEDGRAVHYRHVDGVTREMNVVWSFEELADGRTRVRIVHEWAVGPAWPLPRVFRRLIANHIIGPVFIHHVASRTLAGLRSHVEAEARGSAEQTST